MKDILVVHLDSSRSLPWAA